MAGVSRDLAHDLAHCFALTVDINTLQGINPLNAVVRAAHGSLKHELRMAQAALEPLTLHTWRSRLWSSTPPLPAQPRDCHTPPRLCKLHDGSYHRV